MRSPPSWRSPESPGLRGLHRRAALSACRQTVEGFLPHIPAFLGNQISRPCLLADGIRPACSTLRWRTDRGKKCGGAGTCSRIFCGDDGPLPPPLTCFHRTQADTSAMTGLSVTSSRMATDIQRSPNREHSRLSSIRRGVEKTGSCRMSQRLNSNASVRRMPIAATSVSRAQIWNVAEAPFPGKPTHTFSEFGAWSPPAPKMLFTFWRVWRFGALDTLAGRCGTSTLRVPWRRHRVGGSAELLRIPASPIFVRRPWRCGDRPPALIAAPAPAPALSNAGVGLRANSTRCVYHGLLPAPTVPNGVHAPPPRPDGYPRSRPDHDQLDSPNVARPSGCWWDDGSSHS